MRAAFQAFGRRPVGLCSAGLLVWGAVAAAPTTNPTGGEPLRSGPSAQAPAGPAVPTASPVVTLPNQPPTPGVLGDWGGVRSRLVGQGLTVAAAVYYDNSKNFQGGLSTSRDASREFFDLDVTFTTDQALHWHGGTFFLNFLDHQGGDGSVALTGDVQGFDNQDGPRGDQIYQAYFQQLLADDTLRLKVGRIDATTDFAFVANGAAFLGSSFGYSPAITAFPTYPDPAVGAALFWTPDDHFYATGGVDDANRSDRAGILDGSPYAVRPTTGGVFLIAELGGKWTVGPDLLAGRLGVGGYHHTGQFRRFDGADQGGASGTYAVLDQSLWQPAGGAAGTGVGLFAQYGLADPKVSLVEQHVGRGLQWTGPLPVPSRAADVTGVGLSYVQLSTRASLPRHHEVEVEGFYKVQVTPWFNLQPDVQYLLSPGGRAGRDAVVATVRGELDF